MNTKQLVLLISLFLVRSIISTTAIDFIYSNSENIIEFIFNISDSSSSISQYDKEILTLPDRCHSFAISSQTNTFLLACNQGIWLAHTYNFKAPILLYSGFGCTQIHTKQSNKKYEFASYALCFGDFVKILT